MFVALRHSHDDVLRERYCSTLCSRISQSKLLIIRLDHFFCSSAVLGCSDSSYYIADALQKNRVVTTFWNQLDLHSRISPKSTCTNSISRFLEWLVSQQVFASYQLFLKTKTGYDATLLRRFVAILHVGTADIV